MNIETVTKEYLLEAINQQYPIATLMAIEDTVGVYNFNIGFKVVEDIINRFWFIVKVPLKDTGYAMKLEAVHIKNYLENEISIEQYSVGSPLNE